MPSDDAIEREPTPIENERVRRVELVLSNLLRTGVVASFAIILIGTAISFSRHPDYVNSRGQLAHLTRPGAAFPHTMRQVWEGAVNLRGQAIVVVGLLVLIATPVMRVAASVFAFVYQRDGAFVAITSLVLALLLLSFFLGRVEG
ncbi:MAG: DUF1634 domain-containing protein [Tepidisphaerales bacterium]